MKLFTDQILNISVDEISPNAINPNKMPDPTFKKLKLSLKKFGQLNPIIVRMLQVNKYEIIDGEYRWRASKDIGLREVQCKVIEATEDEVAGLIFATTIKGKHDVYATCEIVEKLVKTEDSASLQAMNLDKGKIERQIKYHGSDKLKVVRKKEKRMKDEKDSANVKPIDKYKKLIFLVDAPKYCKIEDEKVVLK